MSINIKAGSEALLAAQFVDQDRLWDRMMSMADIGSLPNGGVNRPALSSSDIEARQRLLSWAGDFGFETKLDNIANLFIRLPGSENNAPPVTTGSHLDTQPRGGKFDGAYGVVGGFECLEAIYRSGIKIRRPIEVVAWTNEEGGRYQPGVMGSSIYVEELRLEDQLNKKDADGIRLEDALKKTLDSTPLLSRRDFNSPMSAYLEAHIEQGPILEGLNKTIGVVSGIQGLCWFEVEIFGEEAHAGTTPLNKRKDALQVAISIIAKLQSSILSYGDSTRFTVGRFICEPGSPSTIPGRVSFTIDFRHPEKSVIEEISNVITTVCSNHANDCKVTVDPLIFNMPVDFDPRVINCVESAASALNHEYNLMPSGAGHDAGYIAKCYPAGMIFVPCAGGVSHNEAESASASDLAAGIETLTVCLVELANS
tara:strand:- start:29225 stop:30496 length:1272 start_codon:yes stop_codon:yes gene_type:complete